MADKTSPNRNDTANVSASARPAQATSNETRPAAPAVKVAGGDSDAPVVADAEAPDGLLALTAPEIPDLGTVDTDAAIEECAETLRQHSEFLSALSARTDRALHLLLAMVFLAVAALPISLFERRLSTMGIGRPRSNNPYSLPLAVYLGLDVDHSDKEQAKAASRKLSTYAGALMQLDHVLESEWPAGDRLFNRISVERVADKIVSSGGINALSRAQSEANAAKNPDLIELDSAKTVDLLYKRGEALVTKDAPGSRPIGLTMALASGTARIAGPLFDALPDDLTRDFYRHIGAVDERVGLLAEFLQLAKIVEEPKTDVLKDAADNSDDPKSPRRKGTAQIIFCPDRSVTCSSILTTSSIVLKAHPADYLDFEVKGHLQMETRGRRKLELNLNDRARLPAFDVRFVSAANTQGIARMELYSDAVKEKADCVSVGALLQLARSKQGNLPLVVDEHRFKPKFEGVIAQASWNELVSDFPAELRSMAKKDASSITIALSPARGEFACQPRKQIVDVAGGNTEHVVSITFSDFIRLCGAVADVKLTSGVRIRTDDDLVVFELQTSRNGYSIFIPAKTQEGRSRRYLAKLDPKPWPDQPSA